MVCYRRERWLLPDGRTVVAPLPPGIGDHFGPELRRFILAQYHQGQTTVPRLVELLGTLGVDISKRQVVRILTESIRRKVARRHDSSILVGTMGVDSGPLSGRVRLRRPTLGDEP